jgi:hypothetical protein
MSVRYLNFRNAEQARALPSIAKPLCPYCIVAHRPPKNDRRNYLKPTVVSCS